MSLKFHRGDLVFYPAHGLAKIVAVRKEKLEGQRMTFLVLDLMDRGCVVKISVHRAIELGLRPILNRVQAKKVFQILMSPPAPFRGNWGKRLRECVQKLQKGSPYEMAEVLRDLIVAQNRKGKGLSFAERRLLELAKQMLIKELAFAVQEDEGRIALRVEEMVLSASSPSEARKSSRPSSPS